MRRPFLSQFKQVPYLGDQFDSPFYLPRSINQHILGDGHTIFLIAAYAKMPSMSIPMRMLLPIKMAAC